MVAQAGSNCMTCAEKPRTDGDEISTATKVFRIVKLVALKTDNGNVDRFKNYKMAAAKPEVSPSRERWKISKPFQNQM